MQELKPCPFCGGEAKVVMRMQGFAEAFGVTCKDKACRGRPYKLLRAKHKAIEAWNRRAEE